MQKPAFSTCSGRHRQKHIRGCQTLRFPSPRLILFSGTPLSDVCRRGCLSLPRSCLCSAWMSRKKWEASLGRTMTWHRNQVVTRRNVVIHKNAEIKVTLPTQGEIETAMRDAPQSQHVRCHVKLTWVIFGLCYDTPTESHTTYCVSHITCEYV